MTDIATPAVDTAAATWIKSSYSGGEGNECVEVTHAQSWVGIRDSKAPGRGTLAISPSTFTMFVNEVKARPASS
ncbi:DUF397 domain-containing protein [Streptomyces sp. NPDC020898]|uniref:DUF397 domain-containing protein n=1 Tax=Streptomyces sp. NPDC020898 TaxID=3365101 RepID=UPI0037890D35